MKTIANLNKILGLIDNGQPVYLKIKLSDKEFTTYRCEANFCNNSCLKLVADCRIMVNLVRLEAEIVAYYKGSPLTCAVRIIDQINETTHSCSELTIVEPEMVEPLEPTIENAIMILEQQAALAKRAANAQKKI